MAVTPPLEQPARLVTDDSVIVSPKWLAEHMSDPSVVVLSFADPRDNGARFAAGHIPGERQVQASSVMSLLASLAGTPQIDDARAALERAGVSTNSTVVLLGSSVASLFVAVEYLGLRAKVLDGGIARWMAEGRPVSTQPTAVKTGQIAPTLRRDLIADADWVQAHVKSKGVVLFDTRSVAEYTGAESPAHTKGHIPGARHILPEDVSTTSQPYGDFQLRPVDQVRALYAERAQPSDTIVTYCTVGARASKTFLVALHLGYPAKLYLGSYQDWSARGLPLVAGSQP